MALDETIREVPESADRARIRSLADELAAGNASGPAPGKDELRHTARGALEQLGLPTVYLGFAMVAVSNAFWRDRFAAVPFHRRLLFMPRCLLPGPNDHGRPLNDIAEKARDAGYRVMVAEGTPEVVMKMLERDADAVMGVACLHSLEKAFAHIDRMGVPRVAVPLLRDGCADTEVEHDQVMALLTAQRDAASVSPTYLPLWRLARGLFEEPDFSRLLKDVRGPEIARNPTAFRAVETVALDWLKTGGKRLRPFIVLAAYAAAEHGAAALLPEADPEAVAPDSVRGLALAIEALHKASLIHDDIEDGDAFRYGRPTVHCQQGLASAINAGDWLVGLGYRLVAGTTDFAGADAIADILQNLASAHIALCRGQGAELLWSESPWSLTTADALAGYALKTAPAFEAALFAGLRAGGATLDRPLLKRFALCVGEAYQVANDLDDWHATDAGKKIFGRDVMTRRPTLLHALALQKSDPDILRRAQAQARECRLDDMRNLYDNADVFGQAERLLAKLKARAQAVADQAPDPDMRDLLRFLARMILG